jgi:3-oxoadipate enol-lactonase
MSDVVSEASVSGVVDGVWWRALGSGEPLLLIQGLGYSSDMWFRLVPLLTEHFRVLVFDNRGIGRSDGPVDGMTLETMAADAASVVAAAHEVSAHVFGVSLGGIVAQELALTEPQVVRRLILGCTHTADEHVVFAREEVLEMLTSRAELPAEEAARASIQYVYSSATPDRRIEQDLDVRFQHPPSPAAYTAQLQATFDYEGTFSRLPAVAARTLVLHGEDDLLVPPGNGIVVAGQIPGAEVKFLPRAGHVFFSEAPERTAEMLLEFLRAP